jgi:hypothetical protein
MKSIFKILIIIIINSHMQLSFASNMFANNSIVTIESFKSLEPLLEYADNSTLLILDVEYTLLQPKNPWYC